eukprot:SAG31_NODE_3421_length_4296_cov_2.302121_2_plen_145_part_00
MCLEKHSSTGQSALLSATISATISCWLHSCVLLLPPCGFLYGLYRYGLTARYHQGSRRILPWRQGWLRLTTVHAGHLISFLLLMLTLSSFHARSLQQTLAFSIVPKLFALLDSTFKFCELVEQPFPPAKSNSRWYSCRSSCVYQ